MQLLKMLIVKQCHSQNKASWDRSLEERRHGEAFALRVLKALTFRDKLHIFLVRWRAVLLMRTVGGGSRSGVMVLLPIRTVEHYLGSRETEKDNNNNKKVLW